MTEERNEKTIKEQLDYIADKLDESKKKKKFKMPLNVRMSKGKFKKKNFAIVQTIKTNGSVNFKVLEIKDNTIQVGDVYHDASADYVLRYGNYPLLIIPEWNIKPLASGEETKEPFSPKENLKEAIKDGSLTSTEKFILARLKMDMIKPKMQMNFKIILIIIAVGIGVLVVLNQMGIV